jgi:hypothetical protein
MKKLTLGLIAVSAILLPLSQSAQARWVNYRHCHAYPPRQCWHPGYWYAGCWYPGYWSWYPTAVVVLAPY